MIRKHVKECERVCVNDDLKYVFEQDNKAEQYRNAKF